MGLFDRLFGRTKSEVVQPNISFGRFSDTYKADAQYDAWDSAMDKYDKGNYKEAFVDFLDYLKDETGENISFSQSESGVNFSLLQGSKKITGSMDNDKVYARANVVKADFTNVGFMRRLLERNSALQYSRFALDENEDIVALFDSYTLDGSPFKLYHGMKELAINADKQDDLLADEFDMLHTLDDDQIIPISDEEKAIKHQTIIGRTKEVFQMIEEGSLDTVQYAGGLSYLLLAHCYMLDYLIKPEGYMMEKLENINRYFFQNSNLGTHQKNNLIKKDLEDLLERSQADFYKELYDTKATFGLTKPVTHDRLKTIILKELPNMDWYYKNKHYEYALAIPRYILGYTMFNWAVPRPDRELCHLLIEILEAEYFKKLGFQHDYYDTEQKKFGKAAIKEEIESIIKDNKKKYPKLDAATNTLEFKDKCSFAKSFLLMVSNLDLTKSTP